MSTPSPSPPPLNLLCFTLSVFTFLCFPAFTFFFFSLSSQSSTPVLFSSSRLRLQSASPPTPPAVVHGADLDPSFSLQTLPCGAGEPPSALYTCANARCRRTRELPVVHSGPSNQGEAGHQLIFPVVHRVVAGRQPKLFLTLFVSDPGLVPGVTWHVLRTKCPKGMNICPHKPTHTHTRARAHSHTYTQQTNGKHHCNLAVFVLAESWRIALAGHSLSARPARAPRLAHQTLARTTPTRGPATSIQDRRCQITICPDERAPRRKHKTGAVFKYWSYTYRKSWQPFAAVRTIAVTADYPRKHRVHHLTSLSGAASAVQSL